ncbi:unnamed protein product [Paramecium octaurelia]|uniref:Uncharacterized protein n=1 Tax=Paramecium octaurelia TaxID=43137 RepID=A0A8S1XNB3_PAROT|nr:unnamed protein product [Paramecium octaurelia]
MSLLFQKEMKCFGKSKEEQKYFSKKNFIYIQPKLDFLIDYFNFESQTNSLRISPNLKDLLQSYFNDKTSTIYCQCYQHN